MYAIYVWISHAHVHTYTFKMSLYIWYIIGYISAIQNAFSTFKIHLDIETSSSIHVFSKASEVEIR